MNSQTAITLLKNLEQSLDDYCELNDEGKEAFHMAITALELFGNSEQLPSTHSKLENNSPKLDKEIGECNDCIKHGGDWECDRVHCHKGDVPDTNVGELINRQDAIDALDKRFDNVPMEQTTEILLLRKDLRELPSAQPKRTCVNCGRTVNNGGWYADGGTRCPIEEHYALPKDGYCHLWEKRNVTDDDYPERRTDNANIDT